MKLIRSRRRTLSLEIDRGGELIVRAPTRLSTTAINQFIDRKKAWINKTTDRVRAERAVAARSFQEGGTWPYFGRDYQLRYVADGRTEVALHGDILYINQALKNNVLKHLFRWYRRQAAVYLFNRLTTLAARHGFRFRHAALSNARGRWGSCSAKNSLRLNWRLIMAPEEVSDYVVLHELLHTKIKSHNFTFWHHLAALHPDYKRQVLWLRQNGRCLLISL